VGNLFALLTETNDSDVIWCSWASRPALVREDLMSETLSKPLVPTILRHAEDFPWRMQDIGLMALRLDDQREFRLHIWDPTGDVAEPPSTTIRMTSPRRSSWAS
jgi:hypothetical protein